MFRPRRRWTKASHRALREVAVGLLKYLLDDCSDRFRISERANVEGELMTRRGRRVKGTFGNWFLSICAHCRFHVSGGSLGNCFQVHDLDAFSGQRTIDAIEPWSQQHSG